MTDQKQSLESPATVAAPSANGRPRWRQLLAAERLVVPLFLLPAMAFIAVYLLWPITQSINLSFFQWSGIAPDRTFVGLGNWSRLMGDPIFWLSFRNNILLIVLSIALQIPVAMALAVLLDKWTGLAGKTLRAIYFIPLLLSTVAIGVLFTNIYNPTFGLLNDTLQAVGLGELTRPWLGDPSVALYAIIVVVAWQFIPFYMILFAAGLGEVSGDLRDAAYVDGASETQYFFRIALPQLKPIVGVAIVLSVIGSLKYFDVVWVMTQGGPMHSTELMATYMFNMAFRANQMGYGATIASALFLTVLMVSLALLTWRSRRQRLAETT